MTDLPPREGSQERGTHLPERVVRPYVLTRGRTTTDGPQLALEAPVLAIVRPDQLDSSLPPESRAIVSYCQTPLALAEVAAYVRVPIGVARILVADLTRAGLVALRSELALDAHTDVKLLEGLLDGIRSL